MAKQVPSLNASEYVRLKDASGKARGVYLHKPTGLEVPYRSYREQVALPSKGLTSETAPKMTPKVKVTDKSKRETQFVGKLASRTRQSAYEKYSAKVDRYSHMTGMAPREVIHDNYFQFLNKEINRLLAKKERIEVRTRKKGGNVKEATKDIRISLGELFRASGRKQNNDFTALGETDTI